MRFKRIVLLISMHSIHVVRLYDNKIEWQFFLICLHYDVHRSIDAMITKLEQLSFENNVVQQQSV
jgi:hypothetical protein